MKILIICPIPPEFKACCRELSLKGLLNREKQKIRYNKINNTEIFAIQTGPGKKNIFKKLDFAINEYCPDIILDTGSCCSLNSKVEIGNIVLALNSYQYKEDIINKSCLKDINNKEKWIEKVFNISESGKINAVIGIQVCSSFVLKSEEKKNEIKQKVKAHAYNWETAYVYELSNNSKIPALSFRIVTDYGNNSALKDFIKNIKNQSRRLYKFIKILIEKKLFEQLIKSIKH